MNLFFDCLEHRADYICNYTGDSLEQMSHKMLKMLDYTDNMLPRKLELIAVLYKWAPPDFQARFFERTIVLAQEQPLVPAFVVAVCNFFWINNKVFSPVQTQQAEALLTNWAQNLPPTLSDTIQHTMYSFGARFFQQQGSAQQVCLLIPEFLSGLSFLQPPIDFMTIAAVFKYRGISVDILDNRAWHYSEHQLFDLLLPYDVIVVNTTPIDQVQNYFVDYRYALTLKILKQVKSQFPKKKLVVCGSHGTVRCDLLEKQHCADVILLGEYEGACVQVVSSLLRDGDIRHLPNLSLREGTGYSHTTLCDDALHPPLAESLFPDYDAVDLLGYYGNMHYQGVNVKKLHWSILMTSRGCPYQCIFCYKFFGNHIRRYSVKHVMRELRMMWDHHVDSFFIIDQLFTSDRAFVMELCTQMAAEKFRFSWSCQTRIDQLDAELLQVMKQAGCSGIWLGLESVTDEVLSFNQKGTTQQKILACMELLKQAGISFNVFFMLGMPGETKQSLNALYDFMAYHKLPCTKSFMVCTPRYGTQMYALAEREHPSVAEDFFQLNKWKGQISNQVTQQDIQNTIHRLSALLD